MDTQKEYIDFLKKRQQIAPKMVVVHKPGDELYTLQKDPDGYMVRWYADRSFNAQQIADELGIIVVSKEPDKL